MNIYLHERYARWLRFGDGLSIGSKRRAGIDENGELFQPLNYGSLPVQTTQRSRVKSRQQCQVGVEVVQSSERLHHLQELDYTSGRMTEDENVEICLAKMLDVVCRLPFPFSLIGLLEHAAPSPVAHVVEVLREPSQIWTSFLILLFRPDEYFGYVDLLEEFVVEKCHLLCEGVGLEREQRVPSGQGHAPQVGVQNALLRPLTGALLLHDFLT